MFTTQVATSWRPDQNAFKLNEELDTRWRRTRFAGTDRTEMTMTRHRLATWSVAAMLCASCGRDRNGRSVYPASADGGHAKTAVGDTAMVVSAAPLATQVGVDVLRSGGNAIDAAVSVAFALAVAYPTAGNLGGGGFLIARMGQESAALDFREVAPLAASRDMYLDSNGNVTNRSVTGAPAAGVPGTVAGLWEAHRRYGSRPWRELLQPAIDLADHGFVTDSAFIEDLEAEASRLSRFPASATLFLPNGKPVGVGVKWRNPELAATLRRISDRGRAGFYAGETAELIVAEMRRGGGIITLNDLRQYQPRWRQPVEFSYRRARVITMPPPSSGGLTLALITGILGGVDLKALGWHSAEAIHIVAEAERVAYARRNALLADPDFFPTPAETFLSPDTASALRARITAAHSTGSGRPETAGKGPHTTHVSIVDSKGNAVALTTTINLSYGAAETVTGAGFLLNDEMDDFTTKIGALNEMHLRQGERNGIQAGKRMLSSMTPTIVLDSTGSLLLITGAAGGARIITAVVQVLSNVLDFRLPLDSAMAAPRFHAQDFPDSLFIGASGYRGEVLRALVSRGHALAAVSSRDMGKFGWAQSILRSGNQWHGVSEPRGNGSAAGY